MTTRTRLLLMAASGLLVSLSFPSWLTPELTPWTGWLAWIALVPALRALDGVKPKTALWLGWIGGFARWGSTIYWVATIREMEAFRFPAWFLFAGILAGYVAGWAWVVAKGGASRMLWTAPAAWVVMEWVQGRLFTGFPWTPLGSSQWAWHGIFSWCCVTGITGLAWPIVSVNVLVSRMSRTAWDRPARIALPLVILLGSSGDFIRTLGAAADSGSKAIRVALLQGAFTETEKWTVPVGTQFARYGELALRAADAGGVSVMVWPETATVALIETEGLLPRLVKLAKATGAVQVVGALSQDVEFRVRNGTFVIGPTGITGRYHKLRLVPFGEYIPGWFRATVPVARKLTAGLVDMTPGAETVPVTLPGGAPAGVMVCYEAVFPDHARRFTAAGAEVFINVTNDAWYGRTAATFQHALGPLARAVECGRPVLRCANTGLTLLARPDGTFVRELPLFTPGVQVVAVSPSARRTPYSRWGDWPALIAGLAVMCFVFLRDRRA